MIRITLIAFLLTACGQDDAPHDTDHPEPDAGSPEDAASDAHAPDADDRDDGGVIPCTAPYEGMEIESDTVLCAGEVTLEDADDLEGAIRIVTDDVHVRCEGTVVRPAVPHGIDGTATYGFVIEGVRGVTLEGCAAHGFRYGAMARDASEVTIRDCDFGQNFSDPELGWVFDSVQGGGIRLERVTGSTVEDNVLAENWNGVELRDSHRNTVQRNQAAGCSNTGGFVLGANENVIADNDMSYGIRGDGLDFPQSWYGIDTRDSAGLLIDGGSSHNRIERNDLRYGGDGLFLRSVYGACPEHNVATDNDTSFSPHNAIENWCDYNDFIGNEASSSNYGLWLGGGDHMLVSGNHVTSNRVDGISIQIGESRHNVIEDNVIEDSGRVGLLLTGREIQEWDDLNRFADRLASSSHTLISRNRFSDSGSYDVYLLSVRDVTLASNCRGAQDEPWVQRGREAEGVRTIGSCGERPDDAPPQALLEVGQTVIGTPVLLDGSLSSDPDGDALSFVLTVTPDETSFPSGVLEAPLATSETSSLEVLLDLPGIFEANLIVDDGTLASLATTVLFVVPGGEELTEGNSASWGTECEQCPGTVVEDDADVRAVGESSIRVETDAPFDFTVYYPEARDATWDLSAVTYISLFVRTHNPNAGGWQGASPEVVLRDSFGGSARLTPDSDRLRASEGRWVYVHVPLVELVDWSLDDDELDWSSVSSLEIHADTLGWEPYTLWIDGLSFGAPTGS